MAKRDDFKRPRPNDVGDLIISDTRLGVGTTDNLSTLTVQARAQFNLTGTVAKTANSATLIGTSTRFLSEVSLGDRVLVQTGAMEWKTVIGVASDTSLTVDSAFDFTATGQTATLLPSAARFDDATGAAQVVVTDQGTVGIGTLAPNGTLTVVGGTVGDVGSCPVAIHAHVAQMYDAWALALTSDASGGGTCAAMFYVTDGPGHASMTLSFVDGPLSTLAVDAIAFSSQGIHLQSAGISSAPATINQNYTVQANDHYLLADAGASGIVITLPPSDTNGQLVTIVKSAGAGLVSVIPTGIGTINGSTTNLTLGNLYDAISLISTGDTWVALPQPSGVGQPTRVSADYVIKPADRYVIADAGSAGITITLPPSTGDIRTLTIVKSAGAGDVTVAPVPSGQINAQAASLIIANRYDGLHLVSAGNTWIASMLTSGLRVSTPVSADYTIRVTDNTVLADAGTNGITITLPLLDTNLRELTITKSAGSGDVTVAPVSGDQINGAAASLIIANRYDGLRLTSAGDTWIATMLTSGLRAPTPVSADYTIRVTDSTVLADAGTSGITITLPLLDTNLRELTVTKSAGAGDVTIAPVSGDQINGAAVSKTISNLYDGLKLTSAGTTWIATVLTAA